MDEPLREELLLGDNLELLAGVADGSFALV
jgi:hypothetical protein